MRLRLLLTAAALTAALPAAPAGAAATSAATWHGGSTASCSGTVCTYSAASDTCDDAGSPCSATLTATASMVFVNGVNTGCAGSGTLRFTSNGVTENIAVSVRTGPGITVATFVGVRANGTNDSLVTRGQLLAICSGANPLVSQIGFTGELAGTF